MSNVRLLCFKISQAVVCNTCTSFRFLATSLTVYFTKYALFLIASLVLEGYLIYLSLEDVFFCVLVGAAMFVTFYILYAIVDFCRIVWRLTEAERMEVILMQSSSFC